MDLGNFATEEEAARAYDGAARGMRGVSAHGGRKGSTSGTSGHFTLNFPTKEEEEQLEAAGLSPGPPARRSVRGWCSAARRSILILELP